MLAPALDASPSGLLLGRCAAFYEEVARIKLAVREGRLPQYLGAEGTETPGGARMAAMVSERLRALLAQQAKAVRAAPATEAELRAYGVAQYVMAALADEIFVLDLEWGGREAWVHWLLEHALFSSRCAGREFFQHGDQLLRAGPRSALHADLAAVFLLALRLGFKGQHRDGGDASVLSDYRERLLRFIRARSGGAGEGAAFPQAYRNPLRGEKEQRIAPLRRWYLAGAAMLALYLLVSSLVWVLSLRPFYAQFG